MELKVRHRPYYTGFCSTGHHEDCPHVITVTRTEGKKDVYTKSWTCNCDCHKEATDA